MGDVKNRIWIQGGGELASGVAWRVRRCGYRVVCAEVPAPRCVRRPVCFAEAVREGRCEVEGVPGRLVRPAEAAWDDEAVQVVVDPAATAAVRLRPDVVVDGRMTKRSPVPIEGVSSPVIGLGPGFRCGRDASFVIETHRGGRLGEVLATGEAMPNTGVPGAVGGESERRLLRSPAAGRLVPQAAIGDLVTRGQVLGSVAGSPVSSRLDGILRGFIHPEVELSEGEKVGDVDPRGAEVDPHQVTDKSLAVAGGVLEALLRLGIQPS